MSTFVRHKPGSGDGRKTRISLGPEYRRSGYGVQAQTEDRQVMGKGPVTRGHTEGQH